MRNRILAFLFAAVFGITLSMSIIGCKKSTDTSAGDQEAPAAEAPAEPAKDAPAEEAK